MFKESELLCETEKVIFAFLHLRGKTKFSSMLFRSKCTRLKVEQAGVKSLQGDGHCCASFMVEELRPTCIVLHSWLRNCVQIGCRFALRGVCSRQGHSRLTQLPNESLGYINSITRSWKRYQKHHGDDGEDVVDHGVLESQSRSSKPSKHTEDRSEKRKSKLLLVVETQRLFQARRNY